MRITLITIRGRSWSAIIAAVRAFVVALALFAFPLCASADPIPLPPVLPHCPDGSQAKLLWPSREGYCEPTPCVPVCGRGRRCHDACLCVATIQGRTGPDGGERDLPNVVSACSDGVGTLSVCPSNTEAQNGSYCMRRAPRPARPSHARPMLLKASWLPAMSLAPLALALGSVSLLRRRRAAS